jgi:hypothetical protein
MALAEDIARLYQLPLGEFTAARNALAKRASPADKLQIGLAHKPTLPAWAVNQLFWRKRKVFDRLLDSARRLRVEHGRQLSGRQADVSAADRVHQEAIKAAAEEIRGILISSGEADSPQTMSAVLETLQGLPGRDDHGRLTKPLKPQGFEALAGLVRGGETVARLSAVPAAAPAPAGRKPTAAQKERADAAAQKREAATKQKARAAANRELKKARVAERNSRADYARLEMQLARAERERKDLQARIDETIAHRDRLSLELDRARKALERAVGDRERLERLAT